MSAATVFPSPSLERHEHEPFASSGEQLAAELQWLELVLRERAATASADRNAKEPFDEFAGMYVSEREIAGYAARPSRMTGMAALSDRTRRLRDALDARAPSAASDALRLERLVRRFGLRSVERHVLVCCMAPDWALRFQRYFAYLQNDVTRRRPTMQLLGELFGDGEASVAMRTLFAPDAPLVRDGIMSIPADGPFPARQPVVADAVIEYLAGATRVEAALAAFASLRFVSRAEIGRAASGTAITSTSPCGCRRASRPMAGCQRRTSPARHARGSISSRARWLRGPACGSSGWTAARGATRER
jgi:hypothetical protein